MATLGQYNPAKMTAQEVFDAACDHLLGQNAKSMNPDGSCQYKGPDGLCCGAAPFLVDYDPAMENVTYKSIVNPHPEDEVSWHQPSDHMDLIAIIQRIHDNCDVENWKKSLRRVANMFGLTTNF